MGGIDLDFERDAFVGLILRLGSAQVPDYLRVAIIDGDDIVVVVGHDFRLEENFRFRIR